MPPRKRKFHHRSYDDRLVTSSSERASNEYFAALEIHSSSTHASSYKPIISHTIVHEDPTSTEPTSDPPLFIQAYEADVLLGSRSLDSANAMDVTDQGQGDALVCWQAGGSSTRWPSDDEVLQFGSDAQLDTLLSSDVWVDRCVSDVPSQYQISLCCTRLWLSTRVKTSLVSLSLGESYLGSLLRSFARYLNGSFTLYVFEVPN